MEPDTSAYGIGAVLYHVLKDGSEHPVSYASLEKRKELRPSRKRGPSFSFCSKEIPSVHLWGKITPITDHKPLLTILGPKSGIPSIAAARMQRWSFILPAYQYSNQPKYTVMLMAYQDYLKNLTLNGYQYLPAKFKEQLKMIQHSVKKSLILSMVSVSYRKGGGGGKPWDIPPNL